MIRGAAVPALALALAAGCGGSMVATSGPRQVDIPVAEGPHFKAGASGAARQGVPASGTSKDSPFPRVARFKLPNGLEVAVVTARALPVVQARLVVRAGGADAAPGVAILTAELSKDGGTLALPSAELVRRIATLGADLGVSTGFDATVFSLPLIKEQLGEGLSLLAQVVREPRFDEGELRKLKARATDRATDEARSDGSVAALHLAFLELFPEKSAYAFYGALPSQIVRVDGGAIREFHRSFYVPKATTLVLAGDLDEAEAKKLVEQHFGAWTGGDRPKLERAAPRPRSKLRVVVAHRARSLQSDIFVATLGPARKSESWAALRVTNQVLGAGTASRLSNDLREHRGLADTTNVRTFELATGEQPVLAYAAAETAKTGQAVTALLENLVRMSSSPPTSSETEIARSYVSHAFAIRMETIGSIADMVVLQDEFGLPDGYWDAYRRQLRKTEPSEVQAAARMLHPIDRALVVVAGDADAIAPELAKLGDVTVVDPEKEFKTMRTIPQATK